MRRSYRKREPLPTRYAAELGIDEARASYDEHLLHV